MADTSKKKVTVAQLASFADKVDKRLDDVEKAVICDTTPTEGSTQPITSGAVYEALGDVGAILDSINGEVV